MSPNAKIVEIFPTPLWILDFDPDEYRPVNADLLRTIENLTAERQPRPVGGTWQTDPILHTLPQFAGFFKFIQPAIRGALGSLSLVHDAHEITGCWANINPAGGQNSAHTHPNNFLSGVYYVSVPKGTGRIMFGDPRPQANVILPPVRESNKFVGNEVTVDVQDGRLILFPAWLSHSVQVNQTTAHRVSISFNVMFANFTATMSKPLWKGTVPLK